MTTIITITMMVLFLFSMGKMGLNYDKFKYLEHNNKRKSDIHLIALVFYSIISAVLFAGIVARII